MGNKAAVFVRNESKEDICIEAFEGADNPMHWRPCVTMKLPSLGEGKMECPVSLTSMHVRFICGGKHYLMKLPAASYLHFCSDNSVVCSDALTGQDILPVEVCKILFWS
jgi:hypothetical protein